MTNRRGFFKEFVGQVGVLWDDLKGVENIPLKRLNELPEDIIERIVPVFFPEVDWYIEDDKLFFKEGKGKTKRSISVNQMDHVILELFQQNISLKQTAQKIEIAANIPFEEIYKDVTLLFFRLASFRICHPKEIYGMDAILGDENK